MYITPSQSNILATYYVNPLLHGVPNGATGTGKSFGYPLYVQQATNSASASVLRGGLGTTSGMTSTGNGVRTGPGPRFTTGIGFEVAMPNATELHSQLQQTLSNSSPTFTGLGNQMTVERGSSGFVLRGKAASQTERRRGSSDPVIHSRRRRDPQRNCGPAARESASAASVAFPVADASTNIARPRNSEFLGYVITPGATLLARQDCATMHGEPEA